jgi:uncharacterized protein (TIGR00255 family)
MTGYGTGAAENARRRIDVVAQSWNHRHLDLVVRLPESHRFLEPVVRERAARQASRGRCEVIVRIESRGDRRLALRVDREAVRALRAEGTELEAAGLAEARLSLGDLLRVPQLVSFEAPADEWTVADRELLEQALDAALAAFAVARAGEGARLREALLRARTELGALVDELERRRRALAGNAERQLRERLDALLPGGAEGLPPERLAQEVVLLVERGDVREELDRLRSHLAHFDEIAAEEGAVGKRLDFLVQELLREINTLGAKSRDAESTRRVVDAKVLCEQMREQIQNVE